MPSITTHHIFSKDILTKLDENTLSKFNEKLDIYHTFAQSHDYLFYYTFNPFKAKEIKKLGHTAHKHNTQDYLLNIIKEIKNNNLENNHELIAYLYGSITHYVLDSTCHPYIFYKTGVYNKKDKLTYKYKGQHNKIEKDLDAIYYEKYTNKKYNTCNLNKFVIGSPKFSKTLINSISNVYEKTYNKKNIGKYYYNGIIHAKILNFIIVNDCLGIKKAIYRFLERITNYHIGHISVYSTHILNPNTSYLNEEHHTWNHPSIKELTFNYSFEDLYNQSIEKTLSIITEVNKVLFENKPIETLNEIIPDVSYTTGLIIKENKKMKFFEY